MKAVKIAVILILVLNGAVSLVNWATKDTSEARQVTQQIDSQPLQSSIVAADGLDLAALTALVKDVRSGQELERRLNEKGSINNLDLNGDEKVDYINVNEFGDVTDKIGYALVTQPVKNETQEIATVTLEKNGETAEIQVIGNEQIYGDQAIYNDTTLIEREGTQVTQNQNSAAPIYNNYFYPRPLWISPWYFGFYPPFFSPFPIIGRTTYVTRMNSQYRGANVKRGYNSYQRSSSKQVKNPYKGKTANSGISRSLKKPTSTQKQFQVNRGKNIKSGGFGRSGSTGSSVASSGKSQSTSSPFGRSSSNVKSSRSKSFSSVFSSGSSSSSRSRSFRSSSFGSRSFSLGK